MACVICQFERIDTNADGEVTLEEWHEFLARTHGEQGEKGIMWLTATLHTVSRNLGLQAHSRADPPPSLALASPSSLTATSRPMGAQRLAPPSRWHESHQRGLSGWRCEG